MPQPKARSTKPCQRCKKLPAIPEERFCGKCKMIVQREMRESGYLTPEPLPSFEGRGAAAKERRGETIHGVDD